MSNSIHYVMRKRKGRVVGDPAYRIDAFIETYLPYLLLVSYRALFQSATPEPLSSVLLISSRVVPQKVNI